LGDEDEERDLLEDLVVDDRKLFERIVCDSVTRIYLAQEWSK
jgi:hypothetical protein